MSTGCGFTPQPHKATVKSELMAHLTQYMLFQRHHHCLDVVNRKDGVSLAGDSVNKADVAGEPQVFCCRLIAGKGDYGDVMLARVDAAGPDAGQQQQSGSLVVVKSLLSSAAHHQRAFEHEAEMFSMAAAGRYTAATSDCHVVRLLGVCCSLQPPLIVTEYCQLVCSLLHIHWPKFM